MEAQSQAVASKGTAVAVVALQAVLDAKKLSIVGKAAEYKLEVKAGNFCRNGRGSADGIERAQGALKTSGAPHLAAHVNEEESPSLCREIVKETL